MGVSMSDVGELLFALRRRGVELRACGGRLLWRPRGAVSAAEREALARHKAELLALLAAQADSAPRPAPGTAGSSEPAGTWVGGRWYATGAEGLRTPFDPPEPSPACPAGAPTPLATWPDPDAAELIAWFATFPWPREPFALRPG